MALRTGALLAVLFSLLSCGPMNERPAADFSNGPSAGALGDTTLSKENKFYIYIGGSTNASGALSRQPELGENTYTVRFVHTDHLVFPGLDARVTAAYEMPTMPDMGSETAIGIRRSDGSFILNLFYSMPGTWKVTIRFEDGEIADEHTFEILL